MRSILVSRYPALIGILCLFIITALSSGCQKPTAIIPQGCYYSGDGKPFMAVGVNKLTLFIPGEVHSSAIGPWLSANVGRFQVSPGFYLHDGTASPPAGREVMSQMLTTGRSGSLTYRRIGTQDVVAVPVEAYGYLRVVRGKSCKASTR